MAPAGLLTLLCKAQPPFFGCFCVFCFHKALRKETKYPSRNPFRHQRGGLPEKKRPKSSNSYQRVSQTPGCGNTIAMDPYPKRCAGHRGSAFRNTKRTGGRPESCGHRKAEEKRSARKVQKRRQIRGVFAGGRVQRERPVCFLERDGLDQQAEEFCMRPAPNGLLLLALAFWLHFFPFPDLWRPFSSFSKAFLFRIFCWHGWKKGA